jgi:hypothetical protein
MDFGSSGILHRAAGNITSSTERNTLEDQHNKPQRRETLLSRITLVYL